MGVRKQYRDSTVFQALSDSIQKRRNLRRQADANNKTALAKKFNLSKKQIEWYGHNGNRSNHPDGPTIYELYQHSRQLSQQANALTNERLGEKYDVSENHVHYLSKELPDMENDL